MFLIVLLETNIIPLLLLSFQKTKQIEIPLTISSVHPYSSFIQKSNMLSSVGYELLTGSFYVGTPKQKFNMIIDTTAQFSWLPNSNLNNTYLHTFDSSKSSTYFSVGTSINAPNEDLFQSGDVSSDIFDYTNQKRRQRLSPFQFILIDTSDEKIHQIEGYDGLISLHVPQSELNTNNASPYSFSEYLLQEHLIDHNKFAIEVLPYNQSTLYLDEEEKINQIIYNKKNSFDKCFSDSSKGRIWNCQFSHIHIGKNMSFTMSLANKNAIIDSTNPYIIAPEKDGMAILEYYKKKNPSCGIYGREEKYYFMVCDMKLDIDKVEDLCFTFTTRDICIKSKDLFYKGKDGISNYEVLIFKVIIKSFKDTWEFGLPMFYNKMIVFDGENSEITFVDVNDIKDFAHKHSNINILNDNIVIINIFTFLTVLSLCSVICLIIIKKKITTIHLGMYRKINKFKGLYI